MAVDFLKFSSVLLLLGTYPLFLKFWKAKTPAVAILFFIWWALLFVVSILGFEEIGRVQLAKQILLMEQKETQTHLGCDVAGPSYFKENCSD